MFKPDNSLQKTAVVEKNDGVDTIMPFGKYKGMPVSAVISDVQYSEWLQDQPWFREQHAKIFNLIVNCTGQVYDSPEHNEMQAMFLKRDVQASTLFSVFYDDSEKGSANWYKRVCKVWPLISISGVAPTFEKDGWDVVLNVHVDGDKARSGIYWPRNWHYYELEPRTSGRVYIELKPEIGDDMMAVLREVRNRITRTEIDLRKSLALGPIAFRYVMIYRSFSGTTVSEEDMRSIFWHSDVLALRENEIVPCDNNWNSIVEVGNLARRCCDKIRENNYVWPDGMVVE